LAARIRERYPRIGALVLAQHVEPAYADLLARSRPRVGYPLKDRVFAASELEAALGTSTTVKRSSMRI
jgi:hypothetical protein